MRKTALMTVVLGLATLAMIQIPRAEATAAPSLWSEPLDFGSACSYCTNCSGMHATVEGSDYEGLHDEPLNCNHSGTCASQHGLCGVGFASQQEQEYVLTALIDAAQDGRRNEAIEIARKYAERVRYVPERTAVQVLGCEGHVALHIPLVSVD